MIKTKEEVDIENRALKRKVLLEMELKKIVEALIAKYKPGKIFLFGSLAEGKIHEWSDIDIVIVKATNKRFMDRLKEVALMCDYSVGVNFFVYTPEEILEAKRKTKALRDAQDHSLRLRNRDILVDDIAGDTNHGGCGRRLGNGGFCKGKREQKDDKEKYRHHTLSIVSN